MRKPLTFSMAEYKVKRKQTRCDRFLAEIERMTPWAMLLVVIAPD